MTGPATREKTARPDRTARLTPIAGVVALVAVVLIASGLAVWFRGEAGQLRDSAAAQNDALVERSTTEEVVEQVSDALAKVYSYDFARLDENERSGREVVTGEFAAEFVALFQQVKAVAPAQRTVVTAKVTAAAVKDLDGSRATILVFLDRQVRRGDGVAQTIAAERLSVGTQRVDGRWLISNVAAV